MSRNEPCFCGSGKKQKKCHSDIHPDSRAAEIYKLYDEINRTVLEYQKENIVSPPCNQGCFQCCYDDVLVSEVEFEIIIKEIQNKWSKEKIKTVFERAFENIEEIKRTNPTLYNSLVAENYNKKIEITQILASASKNSFPCPFLEDGKCSIYDVRPFLCRVWGTTHTSHHEDIEVCNIIPSARGNKKITPNIDNIYNRYLHEVTDINLRKISKTAGIRKYPMYFWFKIYAQKNEGKVSDKYFINTEDNFVISMEASNRSLLPNSYHKFL